MKTEIKKINVAGTVGYVISILLIIAAIAGMVATVLCGAAVVAVWKEDVKVKVISDISLHAGNGFFDAIDNFVSIDSEDDLQVTKQDDGLLIRVKTKEDTYGVKRVMASLAVVLAFLISLTVTLYLVKHLMKALKGCETPFSGDVIQCMTRFAWSLIPLIILELCMESVLNMLRYGGEFNLEINLTHILFAAMIYILVLVFRHGAMLQRAADETL